jgi:hypothetical protein
MRFYLLFYLNVFILDIDFSSIILTMVSNGYRYDRGFKYLEDNNCHKVNIFQNDIRYEVMMNTSNPDFIQNTFLIQSHSI